MDFNEYQELAARTAGRHLEDEAKAFLTSHGVEESLAEKLAQIMANEKAVLISALGLAGEAGEFADLIKKTYGHAHPPNPEKEKKELGDALWYLANTCTKRGYSLEEVASGNIDKLKARYPEGFSVEKSLNRNPKDD